MYEAVDDFGERAEQPVSLFVHGRREELPKLGPAEKQPGIEVSGRLISGFGHRSEGVPDGRMCWLGLARFAAAGHG
jgi:hypothetical protein